jgi:hypothetical protein
MANTNYLKNDIENWCRNWLAQQFPGNHFSKQNLKLVTGGNHEFDAVSNDKSIVAGITTRSWKTQGGNLPSGKFDGLYTELYFLNLVDAKIKFLILTNKEMYDDFTRRSQGKVANGIEIKFCQLPLEKSVKVDSVQGIASRELR